MAAMCLSVGMSGAVSACVIYLPECTTPSTGLQTIDRNTASMRPGGMPDAIAVMQDNAQTDGLQDALLIHCPSKSSVIVYSTGFDGRDVGEATDLMQEAIDSSARITFREVRNRLKAKGFNSVIRPIPSDHCACTSGFAPVYNSCPADF